MGGRPCVKGWTGGCVLIFGENIHQPLPPPSFKAPLLRRNHQGVVSTGTPPPDPVCSRHHLSRFMSRFRIRHQELIFPPGCAVFQTFFSMSPTFHINYVQLYVLFPTDCSLGKIFRICLQTQLRVPSFSI